MLGKKRYGFGTTSDDNDADSDQNEADNAQLLQAASQMHFVQQLFEGGTDMGDGDNDEGDDASLDALLRAFAY